MRRLTADDLLAPGRIGSNHPIYKIIKDMRYLKSSVATRENPTALSDLTDFMGSFRAGEILLGTGTVGVDFTGLQLIYPPRSVGGVLYNLLGWNSETLQVALSAVDGALYAAAGAMRVDQDAITVDGLDYVYTHNATYGGEQRTLKLGMDILTGGSAPIGKMQFTGPAASPTELVDNGDFEDGDFTSWTTGGATWSIASLVHAGSYAGKFSTSTPDAVGTLTSDRIGVSAETPYRFECYHRNSTLPVPPTRWVSGTIELKWYDDPAAGSLIDTDVIEMDIDTVGAWILDELDVISPSGAASVAIVFTITHDGVASPASWYVDDVSLIEQGLQITLTFEADGIKVTDPTNGKFPIAPGSIFLEDNYDVLSGAAGSLTLTATSDGTTRNHVAIGRASSASDFALALRVNGQSGAADYGWIVFDTLGYSNDTSDDLMQLIRDNATSARFDADTWANFVVFINDSDEATTRLDIGGLAWGFAANGGVMINVFTGQYLSNAELDSLTLLDARSNNLVAGSKLTLYRLTT